MITTGQERLRQVNIRTSQDRLGQMGTYYRTDLEKFGHIDTGLDRSGLD